MKEKPNYYAIIPADVRYCKKLKPIERLMYAEITCLTNNKGYCWAGNEYFANLFEISHRSVSRHINQLKNFEFISVSMIRDKSSKVERRTIKLTKDSVDTSVAPHRQSCPTPVDKTGQYNNTILNNKKEELFIAWWDVYDKKIGKGVCETKFMNLDLEVCQKCVDVVSDYVASTSDVKYRKNPITWINQGCWDDEVVNQSGGNGEVKGGKWDGMVF
tara:strand:- start:1316 stop:1963 length:648 start_codon:yes stop_codon:yes gene_type:complete